MRKILVAIGSFIIVTALCSASFARNSKTETSRQLSIFNAMVKELSTGYVDTIDMEKAMRMAMDGLLSKTDPYTEYYSHDEQDELLSIASGEYGGIGAVITKREGDRIIVNRPQWDSPSRLAGLRHGDVIRAVNGKTITPSMTVKDVSQMLRGQAGTEITIDVQRPYAEDSLLTFTFNRGSIKVNPMPWAGMIDDHTGYIRLTTFNEQSATAVKDAVLELRRNPGLRGLIIDLRDNGGGLLESAVQIAGLFVDKGTEIVRTRGRDGLNEKIYKTTRKPIAPDLPLVIMVDEETASASEILSGSLQDLDRAVVVGTRSFGKGLVQNSRQLPFNGLLKLTVARYYIPSGRLIQALDYSHRNPDGSPARTPDSLTNEFKTRHGRTVRDGGGITPDILLPDSMGNRLLYNIMADMWAYDYATRYAARAAQAPDPDTFVVTDSIFEDFKAFIDPDRFHYDKLCESGLDYLRKAAVAEGYMNDSVAAQFDILAGMLRHDFDRDLNFNRKDITYILENEISDRYFSEADMVRREARNDPKVDTARAVLADPVRYRAILAPAK